MTPEIDGDEESGYNITRTRVTCWISGEPIQEWPVFEAMRTYERGNHADRLRALEECYREVKARAREFEAGPTKLAREFRIRQRQRWAS